MAGGLVALLDDVAALAKMAAASLDDVGVAAGRAGAKAAGVVVDDAAVTPRYVHNFSAERELPMIRKIATGSLKNKLFFIVPALLLLSQFADWVLTPLLMLGGLYLSYEGAEKVWEMVAHRGDAHADDHGHKAIADTAELLDDTEREEEMVKGAIRTDFILSAEIMVISLNEVAESPLATLALTLLVVAIGITLLVYGAVALIVKADDFGLYLAEGESAVGRKVGLGLVKGMPTFMKVLSTVGLLAMLWVGGHILLVGFDELGWHWPYGQVHHLEEKVAHALTSIGGAAKWLTNTLLSGAFGLVMGALVVGVMHFLPFGHKAKH